MRQCLVPKTPARLLEHKEPSYGTAACESLLALATHVALAQAVKVQKARKPVLTQTEGKVTYQLEREYAKILAAF